MKPDSPTNRTAATHPAGPRTRRHDLDGLRGIAIALVAVFHVWFGRVSGGVDVFLVLSGYFFGGLVLRSALDPTSTLSPVPHLRRLVRRLLPALVVVLAISAVLTVLVQPQTRWQVFADQALASLGYYQNWHLVDSAADYLRAGEAVSPLQHIWSMSVQGQFYIALLALTLALVYLLRPLVTRRMGAVLAVLLSALTIASFVFAIAAQRANPAAAYYDSFARAWQLLAGVLTAMLVSRLDFKWPMWLRTAAASAGLLAILSCGAVIDGAREFPGPWALVPVGATVLVILAGAGGNPTPGAAPPLPLRVLSTRPFIALGAIAYALYLWHWPVLIFWLVHTGRTGVGIAEGAAILLAAGLLAYLTTRFVENPLRSSDSQRTPFRRIGSRWGWRAGVRTAATASAVVVMGVALIGTSFAWRGYSAAQQEHGKDLAVLPTTDYPGARALIEKAKAPDVPMRPSVLEAGSDLPATTLDGCISDFGSAALINCVYGDRDATRTVALAGGSHAEHWISALDLLGQRHGFKVVTYLKMGCPLSTDQAPIIAFTDEPYPECYQWNMEVVDRLIADRPDYLFTTSTRPRLDGVGDITPEGYLEVWDILSANEIGILAMRDNPWLVRDGMLVDPADCLAGGGDAVACGVSRQEALSEHNPTWELVERFPLLKPLDMSDALCDAAVCRAVEGNVLVYHDSHHLSATYVRTMADELGRQMAIATGWW